jgi:hypothetical protein
VADVADWLVRLGLGKYAPAFLDQEIDFDGLRLLTEQDLRELGLPIGPRRKLLEAIGALQGANLRWQGGSELTGEAERRQLTIMFVDLVNSTPMALRLDPEAMRGAARVPGGGHQRDRAARICRQAYGRWRARVFRLAARP